jgi:hypothetical protein
VIGARPTFAAPIGFTGITQTDFSSAATHGNMNYTSIPVLSSPSVLGENPFIPANGWVSGWAISSVQMSYDAANNTLYAGLSSFKEPAFGQYAIFGDADGNGNPGGASAQMAAVGGVDSPNMGGDKSIAMAFAPYNPASPSQPGSPIMIAGIPAIKSLGGSGIDGFTVAKFNGTSGLLQTDFGSALSNVSGNLAFNPSSSHPELEFSISNFSKSGIDPTKGFWMELYAGSGQDVVAGEIGTGWVYVPPVEAQEIPEPTTWMIWAGLAGGIAWRYRRTRSPRS